MTEAIMKPPLNQQHTTIMSHIFISYSKKNRDYARKLADKLLELGFDVWIDDRIDYGDDWWREIVRAIRAAKAFIVIMTDESDASKWVQREVTLADKEHIPAFPVWLDGNFHRSANWAIYVRTQYADVRGGKLPDEGFYNRLAGCVPRKMTAGQEVTPPKPVIEQKTKAAQLIPQPQVAGKKPGRNTQLTEIITAAVIGLVGIAIAAQFDIMTFLLELVPFLVFSGILFANFRFFNHSSYDNSALIFAYFGGFIVFVIGFTILRTSPTVRLGIQSNSFELIAGSVTVGCIIGILFLVLLKWMAKGSAQNWFVFLTNAAVSLSLAVYLFVNGLKEVVVYSTLGFALGIVIERVRSGSDSGGFGNDKLDE